MQDELEQPAIEQDSTSDEVTADHPVAPVKAQDSERVNEDTKPETTKETDSETLGKVMRGEKSPTVKAGQKDNEPKDTQPKTSTALPPELSKYKADGKEHTVKDVAEAQRLMAAGHNYDRRVRELADREKSLDSIVRKEVEKASWATREFTKLVRERPQAGELLDLVHLNPGMEHQLLQYVEYMKRSGKFSEDRHEANKANWELQQRKQADSQRQYDTDYQAGQREAEQMLTKVREDLGLKDGEAFPAEYAKKIGELMDSGEATTIIRAHQILQVESGDLQKRTAEKAKQEALEEIKRKQRSVQQASGMGRGSRISNGSAPGKEVDAETLGAIMAGRASA